MASNIDYKKKLIAYRKSIGAVTPKTVAFKEPITNPDENDEIETAQKLLQPFHCQVQETELADGKQKESPKESSYFKIQLAQSLADKVPKLPSPQPLGDKVLKMPSPHPSADKLSKIPSPQPLADLIPTSGFLKENSLCLLEPIGRYANWNSVHSLLISQPWCCIGDLMAFCDKYEFKAISVSDVQTHANIVSQVRALLSEKAPFDMRRRFPGSIRNEENLLICIGRCPSIEYHLERILSAFRRPLNKLSTEKQNVAKQNFHLAIRELHLDISARISEIHLYDRMIFEREFHLEWQDSME